MCGIAGAIGLGAYDGRRAASSMAGVLAHRGPDDEGVYSVVGFAAGMRRLSIIDVEGGHQPMVSDEGVCIVYNGEAYNYKELRDELISRGFVFKTRSDTEVLLKAYLAYGDSFVEKIRGMFALCIYDPREGNNFILLARDKAGIKPLYYTQTAGGGFYFASEIKAIIAVLDNKPAVDRIALHHYLTLRYVPSPLTIWDGVLKLDPGSALKYNVASGKHTVSRYWEPRFVSEPFNPDRDYDKEFEDLFLDSVERHITTADVPVGVMLSGGIDSSAIAAAASELGHNKIHTFNVSFASGGYYSEAAYARAVAEHIGSTHHEVVIGDKEFYGFLPEVAYHTDEPLADLTCVPLFYVSKLARENVKAALSGEGSDEILAGYDMERLAARLDVLRLTYRLAPRWMLKKAAGLGGRAGKIFTALVEGGPSGYLGARASHITFYWSQKEKEALELEPVADSSTEKLIKDWYAAANGAQALDRLQEVYSRSWLVEDLLMKADKMSMANSLELRVPFLDGPLYDWAARLPLEMKVGGFSSGYVSKRILRRFARKRLPRAIVERPKRGFPVPAYGRLDGEAASLAGRLLLSADSRSRAFFRDDAVRDALNAAAASGGNASHKVWALMIFEYWARKWL